MKTKITTTPKRCIKFEGYIYLPDRTDKSYEYFVGRIPGRIVIYNEYGKPTTDKMMAFSNFGQMLNYINSAFRSSFQSLKKIRK